MDTLHIFQNDTLDLCGKDFYFSHRIITEPFDMYRTHAHNHYEIYFLIHGKRDYFIGNRIIHVKAGDIVFVPAHTIHKTTSVSPTGHERLLINFTENFFDSTIKSAVLRLFQDYCLTVPENVKENINQIFSQISAEYNNCAEYSPLMLKMLLTTLFVRLLRIDPPILRSKENENPAEKQIKKVLDMINNDLSADMTVDYAAQTAGLSKSHFEKTFKQLTGFTFIDYLNTTRLLRAQKLLTKTSRSITDIAFECGYNSSNYFTTVFRKYFGTTPLQFRKKGELP